MVNITFTLKCLTDAGGVINAGGDDAIPKRRVGHRKIKLKNKTLHKNFE